MSLFIRTIEELEQFQEADEQGKLKISGSDPVPIVALREFTPRPRDKGGLSLFEVSDKADALRVAGAASLLAQDLGKKRTMFLAAERAAVEALSLKLAKSSGTLKHPYVDDKHWEADVANHHDACQLARLFLQGEIFVYEGRDVANEARRAIRVNDFDFLKLAEGGPGSPAGKHLLAFVRERVARVEGIPV
jgi:hypothetical protein